MKTRERNHALEQAKAQFDSISEMVLKLISEDSEVSEDAREDIQEDALSVEVSSDWYVPGDTKEKATKYRILLCTGGPAVQITGDLNEYCEPETARIEYQDWGTPWNTYHDADEEILLSYARCFWFGE